MRGEFELAEVLWDAADPCLSDTHREAALTALHTDEPFLAILVVATALARSGYPLPADVYAEFHEWLRQLPEWESQNRSRPMQFELHVVAADIRVSAQAGTVDGRYGDATLCYFILDDAGVAEASHEHQAEALRRWLEVNRPSPSLRMDMRINGFGYLLESPDPSKCGGKECRDRRSGA